MFKLGGAVLLCAAIAAPSAQGVELPEVDDYVDQLPIVLTVSRLAQPLSDTPGAVTIIDRDKIRRSGAREVADLLRLVPGYMVSGWNGANPNAAYHAPIDEYGIRNLVMIDGRSVYSPFSIGDTHRGMMGVILEDIERIEVLRGSNSAAYGTNAMFGVINIITRHSQDTKGGQVSITGGNDGINDHHARIGWGNDIGSFRISASRQKDGGYRNAYDDKALTQVHFRSDLQPTLDHDIQLQAGVVELNAGEGFPTSNGNAPHTIAWHDWYLHGIWRHQLSATEEFKITANFDQEHIGDRAADLAAPTLVYNYSGRGRRLNLEAQHQLVLSPQLRSVWGAGYKYEDALSKNVYFRDDTVAIHETRIFGNMEWRLHPQWLINAGLFLGQHSWTGGYAAPRLMANFNPTSDHSFRIGVTKSQRTPNLLELAGDIRFFKPGSITPDAWEVKASGTVRPETLLTQELGYFGNLRDWNLTADVRLYHERIRGIIDTNGDPSNFINAHQARARGVEYQLRWHPVEETEIWLNQNIQHYDYWDTAPRTDRQPPTHSTTAALFQRLPANLNLSVIYQTSGRMTWRGPKDSVVPDRVDVRLAYPFRIGESRAELSVTVQSLDGPQSVFLPTKKFVLERRTFASLRIEF